MLLCVDIGNTQTALGLFEGDELRAHWAVTTRASDTADEVFQLIAQLLILDGYGTDCIDGVCLASVVPTLTSAWTQIAARLADVEPVVVGPGIKTSLPMRYGNPAEVGADRVADAVAAIAKYGAPAVVVDLGTATNIEVIDRDGAFLGGIIAPGMATGASALFTHAARIPQIDLAIPEKVIGTSTKEAVQSGLVLGEAARVDGLVKRIFDELGYEAPVIATGGLSSYITGLSETVTACEPRLTLEGLRLIYEMNRG